MPSTLSWIDYDSEAQQRAQRILTLFKERDTRDELGFGPIRDAISDTLFPGTSIIHTRLRYMLFIPWMYITQEDKHVASARIRDTARFEQLNLAASLKESGPNELGIIGGNVGEKLQTLPSAIYWAGLGRWGIRLFPGTEGQYQRGLDAIYLRRRRGTASLSAAAEDGDDVSGLWELGAHTFHPGLPAAPEAFPDDATFKLTTDEAHYLQERVRQSCPNSLLTDLLAKPEKISISAPWEHPNLGQFRADQRALLQHGRMFSSVANGAAILYNMLLAELIDDEEKIESIGNAAEEWLESFLANEADVQAWASRMTDFWANVEGRGHEIHPRAQQFVEQWVAVLLVHRELVFDARDARRLVREREIEKKKANSRFTNTRVRDQWGGSSGLQPMVYRWPLVQSYVSDMAAAVR